MVIFLKIISFPVRLILFLLIAIISGIVSGLNHTLGLLLIFSASVVSFIGSLVTGTAIIAGVIIAGGIIFFPDKFESFTDNIPYLIISCVGITAVCIPLILMPILAEKLFDVCDTFAEWLWALAKMILFCDVDEIRYF